MDIMIISVSTYAYIQRGGCAKAVAVNLVAAAVHPSAYDNRHTRTCPKINVQLCKRNKSPFKEGRDIRWRFTITVRLTYIIGDKQFSLISRRRFDYILVKLIDFNICFVAITMCVAICIHISLLKFETAKRC